MPAAAVAGGGQHAPAGGPTPGGMVVPYFYGSNQYVEKIATTSQLLAAGQSEQVHNINPGGFLRGVRLEVRGTGGVIGTGTVSADGPWTTHASVTLENIDGAPICYPMPAYSYMNRQWWSRPWWGDPARRFDTANTINPSWSLFIQPEIKHTAGVLANTDARAQYRVRYTYATSAQFMATVGTATLPTVTTTVYLETWAQPEEKDLRGNQIEELPPGLNLQTIVRRQVLALNAAGADNQFQVTNTGNEIRTFIWIMRNSSNVRADLASDPIRWRIDNRSLGVFGQQEVFNRMSDFYRSLQTGSTRPAGVYVWPRFYDVGRMVGECWMSTTNATYLIWETATAAGGTNGTIEIITDEVVPVGPVPMEFESI